MKKMLTRLSIPFIILYFCASTLNIQAQGGIIFQDEFIDNQNGWPLVNSEIAVTDIRSGFLFLQHSRTTKSISVKKHVPIDETKEYMIVAEITKFDLHKDPGFGLIWGRSDEDNEYNFLISSKGSFKILRLFKGKVQTIIDWHPSKYIKHETSLNRLSIKKVGEEMQFYINHHQVARTKLMPFFGDLVGIKVYHTQKVGVDSFRVYQR